MSKTERAARNFERIAGLLAKHGNEDRARIFWAAAEIAWYRASLEGVEGAADKAAVAAFMQGGL